MKSYHVVVFWRCRVPGFSTPSLPVLIEHHQKRQNMHRIHWNDFFFINCMAIAMRSPDPSTQLGAVIVSPDNRVVASGYNGWPRGVAEMEKGDERLVGSRKYTWMAHAERNAMDNALRAGISVQGCTLYGLIPPCSSCATGICQAGISEFVCLLSTAEFYKQHSSSEWLKNFEDVLAMFREVGVGYRVASMLDPSIVEGFRLRLAGKTFKY